MIRKIDGTIVRAEVVGKEHAVETSASAAVPSPEAADLPGSLRGTTYEIGAPGSAEQLYVTISDVVLNPGSDHELRRPFEISINGRGSESGPWLVALSRILSALFRRGEDVDFLIDELRGVADSRGSGSPVREIADVLEAHLRRSGLLAAAADHRGGPSAAALRIAIQGDEPADDEFPSTAAVCDHCGIRGVVSLEGCLTCLACGDSRCA